MATTADTAATPDVLQKICATTREEVARRMAVRPLERLGEEARKAPPVRGFRKALAARLKEGKPALIAEIKKASPSAGLIRPDFHPADLARAYEQGGASCLSVLTDTPYFQGEDRFLVEARAACTLPVLRKDFMLEPWQIVESRAIGADCVLLILAVLDDAKALALAETARAWGMDALVEVHDEGEMARAARLETGLIGINNRNLRSLVTDIAVTERLAPLAPKDALLVCESGIRQAADIARIRKAGPGCFLVGESLMREDDVTAATRRLLAA